MIERVLLISPVLNEAAHIERVVRSVTVQSRAPDRWVIVDDGSEDGTYEKLAALATDVPFMEVRRSPRRRAGGDGLALALEARAFNEALVTVDRREFSHVGKLDGDVELPPDYFERLLGEFRADPALGIVGGGLLEEEDGDWRPIPIPGYHVHGAVKLYRTDCFEAIGGMEERLGWDTIDETYARMKGFTTRTLPGLVARHHRPWGSAGGRLRGQARHGTCAYILRYPADWVLLRAFKVGRRAPVGLSGLAFAWGYASAALRSADKVQDDDFRRFVRGELRARMRAPLRRMSPRTLAR